MDDLRKISVTSKQSTVKSKVLPTVLFVVAFLSVIILPANGSEISRLIDKLGNKKEAREASDKLAEIGKTAVPGLMEALEDGSKYQKRYAARAIRQMGQDGSGAIHALSKVIEKSKDAGTREYAVEALGNMPIQIDEILPILQKAKRDSNKDVKEKARGIIDKLREDIKRSSIAAIPAKPDSAEEPKQHMLASLCDKMEAVNVKRQSIQEKYDITLTQLEDQLKALDFDRYSLTVAQNPGNGYLYCDLSAFYAGFTLSVGERIAIECSGNQELENLTDGQPITLNLRRNGIHRYETVAGSVATIKKYALVLPRDVERREEVVRDIEQLSREHKIKIDSLYEPLKEMRATLGLHLVYYVSPGSFRMGSHDNDDEKPVHTVEISQGYWIGTHEVTQQQYESIMGSNPSFFRPGASKPVERVSWDMAVSFCEKLTDHERRAGRLLEGYEYRLPTEAEWEYAARGGSSGRFIEHASSNSLGDVAWYYANSAHETHPVGQKQANGLGLYDMFGNVCEWCLDWYGGYTSGSQTDPAGPARPVGREIELGGRRVTRGGSWRDQGVLCRCSSRSQDQSWNDHTGFRVVLAPVH